jgi:hypothetical protein
MSTKRLPGQPGLIAEHGSRDTPDSFEVCDDSAGEARSRVIERQDLGHLERGFELRDSVFASDASKPVHDFGDRCRRGRKATLLRQVLGRSGGYDGALL